MITEPDTGSDVASIRTAARRVPDGYVIDGSKMFITGGVRADIIVTAAKTSDAGGHYGRSLLIVERGPGVQSTAIEKLGWHASDTALITFDDVFVPEQNLLGEDSGPAHSGEAGSRASGKREGRHQAIRHKLAELAMRIEAGRDVTYSALRRTWRASMP